MQESPGIRLRLEVWRRACATVGAHTVTDKAALINVDAGTISRIEHGSSPSAKFIASAVLALNTTFDALFEIRQPVAA